MVGFGFGFGLEVVVWGVWVAAIDCLRALVRVEAFGLGYDKTVRIELTWFVV